MPSRLSLKILQGVVTKEEYQAYQTDSPQYKKDMWARTQMEMWSLNSLRPRCDYQIKVISYPTAFDVNLDRIAVNGDDEDNLQGGGNIHNGSNPGLPGGGPTTSGRSL